MQLHTLHGAHNIITLKRGCWRIVGSYRKQTGLFGILLLLTQIVSCCLKK